MLNFGFQQKWFRKEFYSEASLKQEKDQCCNAVQNDLIRVWFDVKSFND